MQETSSFYQFNIIMMMMNKFTLLLCFWSAIAVSHAFTTPAPYHLPSSTKAVQSPTSLQISFFEELIGIITKATTSLACQARDLVTSLIEQDQCFATEAGAVAFGHACAETVVYHDCFEPEPFVGKQVSLVLCIGI
jgi:hypothetical protein